MCLTLSFAETISYSVLASGLVGAAEKVHQTVRELCAGLERLEKKHVEALAQYKAHLENNEVSAPRELEPLILKMMTACNDPRARTRPTESATVPERAIRNK